MALAPRNNPADKGGNRSSVKSAAGKAAQRARNGTSSGSSGGAKRVQQYPSLDWTEVEDDVEHVVDLAMKVTQAQLGANGYFIMQCAIPASYAHAAIDAAMASNDAMLYVRMYRVSIDKFLEAMQEDEDDETTK
jgi:hypothetical protein